MQSGTANQPEVQRGVNPRYRRQLFNFSSDCPSTLSNVVSYTYDAFPLPPTPSSMKNDPVIQSTIKDNMRLFKIVTPVHVDIFENYLSSHPNQVFVQSISDGLRNGFWPGAAFAINDYPHIVDESDHHPPLSTEEVQFIREQ